MPVCSEHERFNSEITKKLDHIIDALMGSIENPDKVSIVAEVRDLKRRVVEVEGFIAGVKKQFNILVIKLAGIVAGGIVAGTISIKHFAK